MNKSDIDYIIEKLEFYKPDNIYNGYNSEREKQDQRVSEVLDSIIAEIKSDYENNHMPASKELVLTCKLDEEQMQRLKEQIESAKMSIEPMSIEPVEDIEIKYNWIKCSDKKPPEYKDILFYSPYYGGFIEKGCFTNESHVYFYKYGIINGEDVTHWMLSPKPPEVE